MDLSIFISKPPILFLYFEFIFFSDYIVDAVVGGQMPLGWRHSFSLLLGCCWCSQLSPFLGISQGHSEIFHPKLHPIPRDNLYLLTGWCWGTKVWLHSLIRGTSEGPSPPIHSALSRGLAEPLLLCITIPLLPGPASLTSHGCCCSEYSQQTSCT